MSKDFYRVTEILSPFSDFGHIDPKVLQNAANRGNRVHDLCEKYAKEGIAFPDKECQPYYASFTRWYNDNVNQLYFAEKRLWSEVLRLTGKIDLLVKLKGDGYGSTLIDIKTPQATSPSWVLQTAAYQWLCENELKVHIARRACLMLDRRGGAARLVEYKDYSSNWRIYNGLLDAFVWHDRMEANPHSREPQDPELTAEWHAYLREKRDNFSV